MQDVYESTTTGDTEKPKYKSEESVGSLNQKMEETHVDQVSVSLFAKYGKEKIELNDLPGDTDIASVKKMIQDKTSILPKRQKLVGLAAVKGKVNDETRLDQLRIKKAGPKILHSFILMGTPEEEIFVDPHEKDDLPQVIDDFDLDFNAGSDEWIQHVANGENLKKFTDHTEVFIMNPPRPNKPLLVLDLDHTLLDFSSKRLQADSTAHIGQGMAAQMKRPHMDEFLTKCYEHYDLVVWSQTHWRWLEMKLTELGMLTHPGYRFCFVLDKTSMFTIKSMKRDGSSVTHHVKPLQIIWTKYPRWGAANTVHLDDLSRNFALNLDSGLKIKAYYRKKSRSRSDAELLGLSKYLALLAKSGLPFDRIDFSAWLEVVSGRASIQDTQKKSRS